MDCLHSLPLSQAYDGPVDKLQPADKFLWQLVRVPQYKERIEMLALEAGFNSLYEDTHACVEAYTEIGQAIEKNNGLLTLLALVREVGNYVNHGGYAGGAAGFSLPSLLKLGDVRGKDEMTLFHFVADQMRLHHQAELDEIEVRERLCEKRAPVCANEVVRANAFVFSVFADAQREAGTATSRGC